MSKYRLVGWLLEFYILATSKVISGSVPTCDIAQSWWLYNAGPLGIQAACTMYVSHIILTLSQPVLVLLMLSARLGSDTFIYHCFDSTGNQALHLLYMKPLLYLFGHCCPVSNYNDKMRCDVLNWLIDWLLTVYNYVSIKRTIFIVKSEWSLFCPLANIPVKYYVLPVKTMVFTNKIKTTAIGKQTIWFSAYLNSQFFFCLVNFISFL